MKYHLIKIKEKEAYSYAIQAEEEPIRYHQLKPRGEDTYSFLQIEDYCSYWKWLKEECSVQAKEEMDICIIYDKKDEAVFLQLIDGARKAALHMPAVSGWANLEADFLDEIAGLGNSQQQIRTKQGVSYIKKEKGIKPIPKPERKPLKEPIGTAEAQKEEKEGPAMPDRLPDEDGRESANSRDLQNYIEKQISEQCRTTVPRQ